MTAHLRPPGITFPSLSSIIPWQPVDVNWLFSAIPDLNRTFLTLLAETTEPIFLLSEISDQIMVKIRMATIIATFKHRAYKSQYTSLALLGTMISSLNKTIELSMASWGENEGPPITKACMVSPLLLPLLSCSMLTIQTHRHKRLDVPSSTPYFYHSLLWTFHHTHRSDLLGGPL